jgi:hypothetical protein
MEAQAKKKLLHITKELKPKSSKRIDEGMTII